ncbi:MAG: HNH endonuclease signature motif containing protein [Alphaproteobacteria bacterium]
MPWANQEAIRAIYAEAALLTDTTGVRHEVDHIYPLQGKFVCGLHCEANLQILTKTENIRKHNRMPEQLGYA